MVFTASFRREEKGRCLDLKYPAKRHRLAHITDSLAISLHANVCIECHIKNLCIQEQLSPDTASFHGISAVFISRRSAFTRPN
jgi:nitrate reductase cytochrome c-type subunit